MLLQYRTYRLICVNKVFVQIKLIPPSPFSSLLITKTSLHNMCPSLGYKEILTTICFLQKAIIIIIRYLMRNISHLCLGKAFQYLFVFYYGLLCNTVDAYYICLVHKYLKSLRLELIYSKQNPFCLSSL